MVYAQIRICPRKWDTKNSLEFLHIKGSPNPGQKLCQLTRKKKSLLNGFCNSGKWQSED